MTIQASLVARPLPAVCDDDNVVASALPCCALLVDANRAKAVKDALKAAGLLDVCRYTSMVGAAPRRVALPVLRVPPAPPAAVATAIVDGVAAWSLHEPTLGRRSLLASPASALRAAVAPLLAAARLPPSLLSELPAKWEKLGDVALLDPRSFSNPAWASLANLWPTVAACLGVSRLCRQQRVDSGVLRRSRAEALLPSGATACWTEVREGRVTYVLDVLQSMFCSGNGTEKARMGALRCYGETVVDLFSGIGYYTLPLLVHAGAARVFACELNPPSVEGLRRGLAANKIPAGRCEILEGDCSVVAPAGVAHRVLLGLLPSSEVGWAAAVCALRGEGGTMHVHGLAGSAPGAPRAWAADVAAAMQRIANEGGGRCGGGGGAWVTQVRHVEIVKSYAPRILHAVADIWAGPAALAPPPPPRTMLSSVPLPSPSASLPSCRPSIRVVTSPTSSADVVDGPPFCRTPALVLGLDVGDAPNLWTPPYLMACPDGASPVVAHVSRSRFLDAVDRNFVFRKMPLRDLVALASTPLPSAASPLSDDGQYMYMRAVGADARREPADFEASFPHLARDVTFPSCISGPPSSRRHHSRVLRVASPRVALWLHYDTRDNVLVQIRGTKRVLLFHPITAGALYLRGSSSEVPTSAVFGEEDNGGGEGEEGAAHRTVFASFPRFPAARAACSDVRLSPGDALFIPRLWAHAVVGEGGEPSVSINTFWGSDDEGEGGGEGEARGGKKAAAPGKAAAQDTYSNVDCANGAVVLRAAEEAVAALGRMAPQARAFYAARLLAQVEDAAA